MDTKISLQSVDVPKPLLIAFRRYVKKYKYISAFMRANKGISRNTIKSILAGNTIHPNTLAKIEKLIKENN